MSKEMLETLVLIASFSSACLLSFIIVLFLFRNNFLKEDQTSINAIKTCIIVFSFILILTLFLFLIFKVIT